MNQAKCDLNAKSTRSKPSPTGTCRKASCLPPDGKKERPVPGRPAWLAARHDIEYPLIRSGMKAPEAQARIDARVAAFDIRLDLRQHLCDFARASGNSRPSCAPWRQKGHCWAPIDGPRWPGSRPGRIPGCRTLQSQRHGVHAHCSASTPPFCPRRRGFADRRTRVSQMPPHGCALVAPTVCVLHRIRIELPLNSLFVSCERRTPDVARTLLDSTCTELVVARQLLICV